MDALSELEQELLTAIEASTLASRTRHVGLLPDLTPETLKQLRTVSPAIYLALSQVEPDGDRWTVSFELLLVTSNARGVEAIRHGDRDTIGIYQLIAGLLSVLRATPGFTPGRARYDRSPVWIALGLAVAALPVTTAIQAPGEIDEADLADFLVFQAEHTLGDIDSPEATDLVALHQTEAADYPFVLIRLSVTSLAEGVDIPDAGLPVPIWPDLSANEWDATQGGGARTPSLYDAPPRVLYDVDDYHNLAPRFSHGQTDVAITFVYAFDTSGDIFKSSFIGDPYIQCQISVSPTTISLRIETVSGRVTISHPYAQSGFSVMTVWVRQTAIELWIDGERQMQQIRSSVGIRADVGISSMQIGNGSALQHFELRENVVDTAQISQWHAALADEYQL